MLTVIPPYKRLVHTTQRRAKPRSAQARVYACPLLRGDCHCSIWFKVSQLEVQTYESCSRRVYFKFLSHLWGKWAIINSAAACLSLVGQHSVGAISTSLGFQNNYAWFCHIKMSLFAIPRCHGCPTQPCRALQCWYPKNTPCEKGMLFIYFTQFETGTLVASQTKVLILKLLF